MTRRMTVVLAATAAVGVSAVGVAIAGAAAPNRIEIVGGTTMKPGHSITDNQRFTPAKLTVTSGATIRLVDQATSRDPHTISFVRRADLPTTAKQALSCDACNAAMAAHEPNEQTGEFGKPVVDVGQPGADRPGDSLAIGPKGRISFKVSAGKGTTLYYLCALHPWMQGRIKVT